MSDEKPTYVDWERAFMDLATRMDVPSALVMTVRTKHTHPAPEGPAARMRIFIEGDVHVICRTLPHGRCDGGGGRAACIAARAFLEEATSAAVAALDRAAADLDEAKALMAEALRSIATYGSIDGAHHKQWLLDRLARILAGGPSAYARWLETAGDWDPGVAP